ncbi:MAG: hypothetical protein OEU54_09540 [Gemmatimonadota bacterium]|nr:hypothetical protein [Gemmatimonadota bacterium]
MHFIRRAVLTVAAVCIAVPAFIATPAAAQDAPIFDQVPAVMYETYRGVNNPAFNDYFAMLVEKYGGTGGHPWAIYRENAKVAYRITVLPEGMPSMLPIQQARVESFQEFDQAQMDMWNAGWGSRHVSIWNTAPAMSVVPDRFTVDDIRALPYNRVVVYHLKWNQAGAFREALRARSALDREAGIEGLVQTAWNGGIGTNAQVVMVRYSSESELALLESRGARMEARAAYREEWQAHNRAMNDAAYRIERHDQRRINDLSYSGN